MSKTKGSYWGAVGLASPFAEAEFRKLCAGLALFATAINCSSLPAPRISWCQVGTHEFGNSSEVDHWSRGGVTKPFGFEKLCQLFQTVPLIFGCVRILKQSYPWKLGLKWCRDVMKLTSYPLRTSSATAWRNFVAASRKMNPFQRHGGNANGSHLTQKEVLVLTFIHDIKDIQ